jgi:N-hydroxyarylamine O-acetyltransferase
MLVRMEALLRHIGLDAMPAPDADGLRELHRAYVRAVPYEDLSVQLGECGPLDPQALTARVTGGRGGYCFELNTVLFELLRAAGLRVGRHQARVNGSVLCNHMALVVDVGGRRFLADAGLGEGPLDPLELADGAVSAGPLRWAVSRSGDGWRLAQHEFGSIASFVFADAPSALAEFEPHHHRLSRTPDSSFVQTLVLQQPHDDRIVTLRSRTLSVDGPGVREREVLPDEAAFAAALRREFRIDPEALGAERMRRLWERAYAQHEEFRATRT